MSRLIAFALFAMLGTMVGAVAADTCHAERGMHVTLFGGVDDPDVLVWDSRDRLIGYAAGSSDTRKFMLPHAILGRPGTTAVVQNCMAAIVHSKFRMDPEDAIGILITSGRYRGRYGWVASSDVHGPGIPEASEKW